VPSAGRVRSRANVPGRCSSRDLADRWQLQVAQRPAGIVVAQVVEVAAGHVTSAWPSNLLISVTVAPACSSSTANVWQPVWVHTRVDARPRRQPVQQVADVLGMQWCVGQRAEQRAVGEAEAGADVEPAGQRIGGVIKLAARTGHARPSYSSSWSADTMWAMSDAAGSCPK
jgi:hypothetical protein